MKGVLTAATCKPNSCDASTAPANGKSGTCSASLAHGAACQPSCNPGYVLSGTVKCTAGKLNVVTCTALKACPAGQFLHGYGNSPQLHGVNDPGTCKNCAAGTFKSGRSTYATLCAAFKPCPAGQQLTGYSAKASGKCTRCPVNTFKRSVGVYTTGCTRWDICGKDEFQKVAGTHTTDRICIPHTRCRTWQYQLKPPTATTDRICAALKSCPPGQQLTGNSATAPGRCFPCPSDTFKAIAGLSKCVAKTKCLHQKSPGTPTTDRTCATASKQCPPGYQPALSKCIPCPANTFKATSSSAKCAAMDKCTNGEYQKTAGTPTTDRVCASHGQCNANEYEVSPPTATADRLCSGAGTCSHGALIAQPQRKQANHCGRCNGGYTLVSRKCVKNVCRCTNGFEKTGVNCTKLGCGLQISACVADKVCNSILAVRNVTDTVAKGMCRANALCKSMDMCASSASMCKSCFPGYVLNAAKTACTAKTCDASAAPANGAKGTCTATLASGSTCSPTCKSGYTVSGRTSCMKGVLTAATCKATTDMSSCTTKTCTKYCKVDVDKNGKITVEDLLRVLARFGETCASVKSACAQADFDANNVVDIEDLLTVLAAFGETRPIHSTLLSCCTTCAAGQGRRRLQPNSIRLFGEQSSASNTTSNSAFEARRSLQSTTDNIAFRASFEGGSDGWTASGKWDRSKQVKDGTTGPARAATGRYFYYLSTSSGSNCHRSYLKSPVLNSSYSYYMTFKYHMYGRTMGRLTLQALVGTNWPAAKCHTMRIRYYPWRKSCCVPTLALWEKRGQQQRSKQGQWRSQDFGDRLKSNVTLPNGTTQVRFVGSRGPGSSGNMAVDDIVIREFPCSVTWGGWGNCTKTCGIGTQSRNYTAKNNCGSLDRLDKLRYRGCFLRACPPRRDCIGAWGSWDRCSKPCGGGRQTRTYRITTSAQSGGTSCPVQNGATQSIICNANVCNRCTCTNGNAATGLECTSNGANICASCRKGYVLVYGSCTKPVTCVCQHGTPATGNVCPTNGATMCSSCTTGHTLNVATGSCMKAAAPLTCRVPQWPFFPYLSAEAAPQWTCNVLFMNFVHASEMTFGFTPGEKAFDAMVDQLKPENRPDCTKLKKKTCNSKTKKYNTCVKAGKGAVWKCAANKDLQTAEKNKLKFTARLGIGLCLQIDKGGQAIYQHDCNLDRPTRHVRGRLDATVSVSAKSVKTTPSYDLQLIGKDFTPIPVGAMVDNVFDTVADASGLPKPVVMLLAGGFSPIVSVLRLLRIEELEFRLNYEADNNDGPKPRHFRFEVSGVVLVRNLQLSRYNPMQFMVDFMAKLTRASRPRMAMIVDVKKSSPFSPSKTYMRFDFGAQPFCVDDMSPRGWVEELNQATRRKTYFHKASGVRQPIRPKDFDCDRSDACVATQNCNCQCKLRIDDREGGGLSFFVEVTTGKPTKFAVGFQTGFKLRVANNQFLHFVGRLQLKTGPPATLDAELKMYGTWQHAFGVDKLHVADAVIGYGLALPLGPHSLVPKNLMLGAQIMMGHTDPKQCAVKLGAYVGYDATDPAENFALIYGTQTPTIKDLVETFLPAKVANTFMKIPGMQALSTVKFGPYEALNKKSCRSTDMAKIQAGCPKLTNQQCYDLFQTCYFVAWAAPMGIDKVQQKLAGFKGPAAIMNVLPTGSYFGASGSLTVGGIVSAAAFHTGLIIPGVGTNKFYFQTGLRLFDFFVGEAYFGYDLDMTKKEMLALAQNAGNPSALKRLPNPEVVIGGSLRLDMVQIKKTLITAVKTLLDISGLLTKITDLLNDIPGLCKKIGVPGFVCKAIDEVGGGLKTVIGTLVSPLLTGVQTILNGIAAAITALVNALPDGISLSLDAKARVNSNSKIEAALTFDVQIKLSSSTSLKFEFQFGDCKGRGCKDKYGPKELSPGALVGAAVDALKNEVKALVVGKAGGNPANMLSNAISAGAKKLDAAGRKVLQAAVRAVANAVNAIAGAALNFAITMGTDSRRRISCGRNYLGGFTSCTDCQPAKGRKQHVLLSRVPGSTGYWHAPQATPAWHTGQSATACFEKCLEVSMEVYAAWTEATTYEAVPFDPSDAWWTQHQIAQVTITADGGIIECKGLCTADVDCAGFTVKQSGTKCLLASRLPRYGPWHCNDRTAAIGVPWVDCRQQNWRRRSKSGSYTTVDDANLDATCGGKLACFFRRATAQTKAQTRQIKPIIDGQLVTHKPCPTCQLETATIRDWTSGACCRRQLVEPYFRVQKNRECHAKATLQLKLFDSLDKCAQACRTTSAVYFSYGFGVVCVGTKCPCWCEETSGTRCLYKNHVVGTRLTIAAASHLYKFEDDKKRLQGECRFMVGTSTKQVGRRYSDADRIGAHHVGATSHHWCDSTFDPVKNADNTFAQKGNMYSTLIKTGGAYKHFGQDLSQLQYEPSRCVAGFNGTRREFTITEVDQLPVGIGR
eukprot:COSAG01_NODE_464_length_16617_cov_126.274428_2_plen_2436_part_00